MKIETVQRWVFAVILIHIGGSPTLALAAYSPHLEQIKHSSGVGLWVMSGVVGLATTAGVLLIHQRSLLSLADRRGTPDDRLGLLRLLIFVGGVPSSSTSPGGRRSGS